MSVLARINQQDLFINLSNSQTAALIVSGIQNSPASGQSYTQNDIVFQRLFFFKNDPTAGLYNVTFAGGTQFGVGGVLQSSPATSNLFGSANFAPLTDSALGFSGYGGTLDLRTSNIGTALANSQSVPILVNVQVMDAVGPSATARATLATFSATLGFDAFNDSGTFINPTLLAGLTGLFRVDIIKRTGGANALESVVTSGIARPIVSGGTMACVEFWNASLSQVQRWVLYYSTDTSNPGNDKVIPLDYDAVNNPCVWLNE